LQIEKKNDKIYTRVNVEDFKFWNNKKDTDEPKQDKTDEEFIEDFLKDTITDLPF
jgi:hypothetical protein